MLPKGRSRCSRSMPTHHRSSPAGSPAASILSSDRSADPRTGCSHVMPQRCPPLRNDGFVGGSTSVACLVESVRHRITGGQTQPPRQRLQRPADPRPHLATGPLPSLDPEEKVPVDRAGLNRRSVDLHRASPAAGQRDRHPGCRRRGYITLRAQGLEPRTIRLLIAAEAGTVAVGGAIAGLLVGAAMGFYFVTVLRPLFVLAPSYTLSPRAVVTPVLLVFIATVIAALAASRLVNRLDPTELLRDD